MKIALIAGGQPRFTPSFLVLMSQLTGFDSADLYLTLWRTNWAQTNEHYHYPISQDPTSL
jgi:hypothetical protein